jgi:sugar phosphate isomerase/epimerase
VIPDRIGANCRALSGLVDEVALMLLETRSCLDYDDGDLPPYLPELGLSFHVHLPMDLPWSEGAEHVAQVIRRLERKISFLNPGDYVLHPPRPGELLALLESYPALDSRLLLENVCDGDLWDIWEEITDLDLGVCLDLGHLVSYGQERILGLPGFFRRVRMLHVYGGESSGGHMGLSALPRPHLLREILSRLTTDVTLVVEVFHLEELRNSLALLRRFLKEWGMDSD